MGLARMVGLDEEALICDFAEAYHVYDWRQLPVKTAATLAMGLRPTSRIMQKLSGAPAPPDTLLLAMAVDVLRVLAWQRTKDGAHGRNFPKSVLQALLGADSGGKIETGPGFGSAEDFNAWRARMMEGDQRG